MRVAAWTGRMCVLRAQTARPISTKAVRVVEVGPRDGLQNETQATLLGVDVRCDLIARLAAAGLRTIEAGSFVSPRWVPQMADTDKVLQQLAHRAEIAAMSSLRLPVLVPNIAGLHAATADPATLPLLKEIAVFVAASDSFSRKNTNCTVEEAVQRASAVCAEAARRDISVRGYVSTAIGCPYEGVVDPQKVREVAVELLRMGCYEVSLGDTIGVGHAGREADAGAQCDIGRVGSVRRLLEVLAARVDPSRLAVHFHDTYGQALANILVALECGIRTVDAAVAGLGGCPYAPGASGNVATEDLVYMLHGLDYFTGVDLRRLAEAGAFITSHLRRPNGSRAATALLARPA